MNGENGTRSYTLRIWRQDGPDRPGRFVEYPVSGIDPNMSFLEMLDQLNEELLRHGERAIEFDSDCREGICGTCGVCIDGRPHGPVPNTTTCTLRMREFPDGATITVEPFRAKAFPVVKDLVVDRSAFDRIVQKGGFVSVNVGSAPEANTVLVPKDVAEEAMDSAACIGCGACVAACPNASAALFVGAKIRHLRLMPHGQPERRRRVLSMVAQMDEEGFGNCSNHGECEAACPKSISIENIATMRREYWLALLGLL
ncbi:MAG: succinate dehydrogenase [Candidatus Binatia bacterium]|nr:MAG: succinate dehydrogenase [Candidatus Binatia bacterium]